LSARRLERARQALEVATDALARVAVTLDAAGVARLDLDRLAGAPEEIAVRLVGRLVVATGGDDAPQSLAKVEALASWLISAPQGGRTLGRAEIQVKGQTARSAIFLRETGRHELPKRALAPGGSILWDGRFRIRLAAGRPGVLIAPGHPGGCGKARQAVPVALREGRLVASALDAETALAAGLVFDFAGQSTIFGPAGPLETQK
jgi:tRNA(Ile)-lysidine synthase